MVKEENLLNRKCCANGVGYLGCVGYVSCSSYLGWIGYAEVIVDACKGLDGKSADGDEIVVLES